MLSLSTRTVALPTKYGCEFAMSYMLHAHVTMTGDVDQVQVREK